MRKVCIFMVSLLLLPLLPLRATVQLATMPSTSRTPPAMPVLSNFRSLPGDRPGQVRVGWDYNSKIEEGFILLCRKHGDASTTRPPSGVIGADMRAYVLTLPEAQTAYDLQLHSATLRITKQVGPASRLSDASSRPDAEPEAPSPAVAAPVVAVVATAANGGARVAMPATNPSLVELMDQVAAGLRSADQEHGQAVTDAKKLLLERMEQAKRVIIKPSQADAITKTCQELTADTPDPAMSEHHVETPIPAVINEPPALGPSNARAAMLSYKADLELAHRRWLKTVAPTTQPGLRILREELGRAERRGNAPLAEKMKAMIVRLDGVEHGDPTIWYREKIAPGGVDPEKEPPRLMPVAVAIHDVQITSAQMGRQLQGSFVVRTLVTPYKINPNMFGPGYFLLLYDGDDIIYYAGGSWNGKHDVDEELTLRFDTHSNVLVGAKGKPFIFTKPGTYTMRLVVINGGGWNDVLDVYENQFAVATPATQP